MKPSVLLVLAVVSLWVSHSSAQVTIYQDANQEGASVEFGPGRKNLAGTPVGDNQASSLSVDASWWVQICDGARSNPTKCLSFGPGTYNLPGSFDDVASSAHIQRLRPKGRGAFGDLIPTRSAAIFSAMGPQGQILYFKIGVNAAAWVFNPETESFSKFPNVPYDIFCTGLAQDSLTGDIILAGGNVGFEGNSAVWRWGTNSWEVLSSLKNDSYYGSTIALADGRAAHLLGSLEKGTNKKTQPEFVEILQPGGSVWEQDFGLPSDELFETTLFNGNWFPILFQLQNGKVLHAGPIPQMNVLDFDASTVTPIGIRAGNDVYRNWVAAAMYDAKGKILMTGGTEGRPTDFATFKSAVTIDATDPDNILSESTNPMALSRTFHTLVILADGQVFVSGGTGYGQVYTAIQSRFPCEIWNPNTGSWKRAAVMTSRRVYHSSALLLVDGTVWTAAGQAQTSGADGNQDSYSKYMPPYLFNPDGTLAPRPTLSGAGNWIVGGPPLVVTAIDPDGLSITRFTAIRMGTSNHAVNLDARFLDLTREGLVQSLGSGNFRLSAFNNVNVMVPGSWIVFAFNRKGVPSKGIPVSVRP